MIKTNIGRVLSDADWACLEARLRTNDIYGVITTGIACQTGCPARTPLRKNVRLFDSVNNAYSAGFRACKRCHPNTDHPVSPAKLSIASVPSLELP